MERRVACGRMDLVFVGAGRAAGSMALASEAAGHRIVGFLTRRPTELGKALSWSRPLPPCDLILVAVSDDAIAAVAERLVPLRTGGTVVAHLSGFVSVAALRPLGEGGIGSLHPLQTLPDASRGSQAIGGAWAAITAVEGSVGRVLSDYAESLGMRPFELADNAKPLYHAAAAAAANYVVESLAVSADLLEAAGVPLEVMEPLTRAIVNNVFTRGPASSLTGPIARGDRDTVFGQIEAANSVSSSLGSQFRLLAQATAERVGMSL